MKSLLVLSLLLSTLTVNAKNFTQPHSQESRKVIKDETHSTTILLDNTTVRCSSLGYGASELKISVPSLEWYAIFDHSNRDDKGPCVTAGMSFCGNFGGPVSIPEVLLQQDNTQEDIDVRIILTEVLRVSNTTCLRMLEEKVETTVRGIDFNHFRVKNIGEIPLEECKF